MDKLRSKRKSTDGGVSDTVRGNREKKFQDAVKDGEK